MSNLMAIIFMSSASFFSGAVPFGYLIGKHIYKTDITLAGSKNIGATNVWRTLGKLPGAVTLALDAFKGYLPVVTGLLIFDNYPFWPCIFGLLAILGHAMNPFFNFKGGKGVATGLGVFLALAPKAVLIALAVFLITTVVTRYVSLGSLLGALTLGIISLFLYESLFLKLIILIAASVVFIRHRSNISRLADGSETKIKFS